MSAGRIALLVIGIIILLAGLALMAGGGGMMGVSQAFKNDEGYITSRTADLASTSYAVVSEPVDFGSGVEWGGDWQPGDFVSLRVEAASNNGKAPFLGIASESDVATYLSDVPYDEVQHWAGHDSGEEAITYRHHSGASAPAPPLSQGFWAASAHGEGPQTLTWSPETGRWVIVLMNEDGSAGIDVGGSIGARIPWLFWAGLGILIAGVVLLAVGILMIVLAARNPRPAQPGPQPAGA